MSDDLEILDSEEVGNGVLSTVGESLGDIVTGIPAPIRKNAIKAIGRLMTAVIEYPVSMIECAIDEMCAESHARVNLINASANQLEAQMQINPAYARTASKKFATKIIREQLNVDRVCNFALSDLKIEPLFTETDNESEVATISEDWLNVFENEAVHMSSEQMQRLFGKILAGEVRKPASYSIKTVKLMAQLDNSAAVLFRLFCSLSVSIRFPKENAIPDARVVPLGKPGDNSLRTYGLGFEQLLILQEYGLISTELETAVKLYGMSVIHKLEMVAPIYYQNETWLLVPKVPSHLFDRPEFVLEGVSFTKSGKELLSVVDIEPNDQYTEALMKHFDNLGMTMTKYDELNKVLI